jgi:hypothetical protein
MTAEKERNYDGTGCESEYVMRVERHEVYEHLAKHSWVRPVRDGNLASKEVDHFSFI